MGDQLPMEHGGIESQSRCLPGIRKARSLSASPSQMLHLPEGATTPADLQWEARLSKWQNSN